MLQHGLLLIMTPPKEEDMAALDTLVAVLVQDTAVLTRLMLQVDGLAAAAAQVHLHTLVVQLLLEVELAVMVVKLMMVVTELAVLQEMLQAVIKVLQG
jgi:hypothetical protein